MLFQLKATEGFSFMQIERSSHVDSHFKITDFQPG